ncbi:MAG: hypothetical protein JW929_00230 [Anaerolineales bacterium]|nr:hypothetical protein [Anaerolineales bacterium]
MNPTPAFSKMHTSRPSLLRFAGGLLLAAAALAAGGKPAGAADVTIYGRPMVVVSAAEVLPQTGREESYPRAFDLRLTVSNIGSITANQVVGTVPANDYVGTESGSAVFGFSYLYPGASAEAVLHMMLDGADEGGRVQPVIHFDYSSYDDEDDITVRYSGDEPVRLTFGEPGWNHPALLIDSLGTEPAVPAPGDPCTLRIRLSNVSAGNAEQVLIRLGGEEGPKPFATVGKGNVGHIARIPAHQTAEAVFALEVDGGSTAGLYPVPVALSYRNVLGVELTDNQVVYLKIRTRPALQAGLIGDLPSPLIAGESFELAVEVINIGTQPINAGTVELTSDELEITNGSVYSGPLNESTSTSLIATAVAEEAGPAEATLTVHYLDEFNQPQTWTHTFQFTIAEAAATEAEAADAGESQSVFEIIWNAILAFLGFGG